MGEFSKIEWTDHTFNPWIGCQEVSAACDNCYARVQNNFRGWVKGWGPHGERKRTKTWRDPVKFNRDAAAEGVRRKVFCASLADVFDNKAEQAWRNDLWDLIDRTPNLDWLLLTKRPENAARMVPGQWATGWPTNVWFGTTAEDGEQYRRRYPHVAAAPAARRFISYEPALGRILLDLICPQVTKPDWIICGGESAKGVHRPMDIEWARDMRDQCQKHGIAFFMKQIDKVKPIPADLMIREFPLSASETAPPTATTEGAPPQNGQDAPDAQASATKEP